MQYVIAIIGNAAGLPCPEAGTYISEVHFAGDASLVQCVQRPSQAKRFESAADAYTFWQTTHPTVPVRPDGRPNRPLTAFDVCIQVLP